MKFELVEKNVIEMTGEMSDEMMVALLEADDASVEDVQMVSRTSVRMSTRRFVRMAS